MGTQEWKSNEQSILFQTNLLNTQSREKWPLKTSGLTELYFCSAFITLSTFLLDPLKIDVNLPSQ